MKGGHHGNHPADLCLPVCSHCALHDDPVIVVIRDTTGFFPNVVESGGRLQGGQDHPMAPLWPALWPTLTMSRTALTHKFVILGETNHETGN